MTTLCDKEALSANSPLKSPCGTYRTSAVLGEAVVLVLTTLWTNSAANTI